MPRRTGSIGSYVISCSSDAERSLGQLFVWGEIGDIRWFPSTVKEARMRVDACRKKMKCRECDAESNNQSGSSQSDHKPAEK